MPLGGGSLSEAERGLRAVFDVLLQDIALRPVEPATLPWNSPIFILRTVPMDVMASLIAEIRRYAANPSIHVMSHARDAESIHALAPGATFHAYTGQGRYRLEDVPAAMLYRLQQAGFGTLIFPDPGTSADLWDAIERVFGAIDSRRMVVYTRDGGFARSDDWQKRRHAQQAFLRLIEWYQSSAGDESSIDVNHALLRPGGATNDRS